MDSGKWPFLAGTGAGAFLVLRLPQHQIESIKDFASQTAQSLNLTAVEATVSERLHAALWHHGNILIDHMTEELKRQPRAAGLNRESVGGENPSTTSNTAGQNNTKKDNHITTNGKIVS